MKTGTYRVRVNSANREDPHCYVKIIGRTGPPAWATSTVSQGAQFTFDCACEVAQRWHDWLIANGLPGPAARMRVVPATGGIETGWRPAKAPVPS